jgi:alpha-L-arabinofuranosidase
VSAHGKELGSAEAVTLTTGDIHDHNTFSEPEKVILSAPRTLTAEQGVIRLTLPAGSIVRILGYI